MICSDIIVAPATAVGIGAIAIIRISGNGCLQLVEPFLSLSRDKLVSHQFCYAYFEYCGRTIDEIMVVYMASPRTFTKEDTVEIHCHNSPAIVQEIIDILIEAGARIAEPGEFSRRAFVNGRLDLSQAEAIVDLIGSQTSAAARIALDQLSGKLSRLLFKYRDSILELLALVEAYVDFPDEDFDLPHFSQLKFQAKSLSDEIDKLLFTFDEGRLLKDGLSVVIIGKPNVGKSSILNRILGTERAIVTDIPGTTRDIIEERVVVEGVALRFADTAGIRTSCDIVEQDGVRRALDKLKCADLVLLVVDDGSDIDIPEYLTSSESPQFILVVNKVDVHGCSTDDFDCNFPVVCVSAKSGAGFTKLFSVIKSIFVYGAQQGDESFMLSDRRHKNALILCQEALLDFIQELDAGLSPEFLALHLRSALQSLGLITGETTPDHVLDSIFARFCVGK